jgi:hypothetical protein
MKKFLIVDKDLDVVDGSNNMLEMRIMCNEVNNRFFDVADECIVMSAKELKVARLVKHDISEIKNSLNLGDTEFLNAVLSGEGFTPYTQLSDEMLEIEYNEMVAMKKELAA